MVNYRIIERPAFDVLGKKGWIAEQDGFGRVWETCRAEGVFAIFETLTGWQRGAHTNGETLGISRVEADPTNREFDYMVAVEVPPGVTHPDLEHYQTATFPEANHSLIGMFSKCRRISGDQPELSNNLSYTPN